jgi:hypothetical protein
VSEVDDLLGWLRERIHTRATIARDALAEWPGGPGSDDVASEVAFVLVGAHIVFNEPRAVLAECAAHLAIVEAVQRWIDGHPGPCDSADDGWTDSCSLHLAWAETSLPPLAARLVGLVYEHHDGYRTEWRPHASTVTSAQ